MGTHATDGIVCNPVTSGPTAVRTALTLVMAMATSVPMPEGSQVVPVRPGAR